MDLKIKDVAELLRVSEVTIRRWLNDGKIPAYRINHQYRFSRIEIEKWMLDCKLKPETLLYPVGERPEEDSKQGQQQFGLYRAINKGGILYSVPGATKEEVIRTSMKQIAGRLNLDADVISELLLDRENLMPTALNHGVAVPHTRDFLLQSPYDVVVVAFPEKPIAYGALDGEPVHTLFFLFATSDKRHLHLLAKLAHLSSQPKAQKLFRTGASSQVILDYVRDWEGIIPAAV